MLVWGFAKLDLVPGADLLRVSRQHFASRMPAYQHQAVANMVYSLARLKQCTPSLCTKVQGQVMERLEDFSPQASSLPASLLVAGFVTSAMQHCRSVCEVACLCRSS
jgi:hypothetical protein